jgi:hypothetical protein
MRRASYREAIDWIAQNDSPADIGANDPERVGELVSCVLIASIFGVEPERVGRDVVRCRIRYGIVSALNNEDAQ